MIILYFNETHKYTILLIPACTCMSFNIEYPSIQNIPTDSFPYFNHTCLHVSSHLSLFLYKNLYIQNISTESFPFFDLHTWVHTIVYFNNATGTDNSRSGGLARGYQSLSRAWAREECGVLERHNHHRQRWTVSTQEAGFQSERYNVSIRLLQYR